MYPIRHCRAISEELCQSLARLGARTTGIDASEANIGIASTHAAGDPQFARSAKSLKYLHTTAEALLAEGKQYDVVCSLEVIEHVSMPSEFLHACAQLVKVGYSFRFFRTSLTQAFVTCPDSIHLAWRPLVSLHRLTHAGGVCIDNPGCGEYPWDRLPRHAHVLQIHQALRITVFLPRVSHTPVSLQDWRTRETLDYAFL